MFQSSIYDDVIYNLDDIEKLIDEFEIKRKNKIEYYNIPASFDIETTSFVDNNEPLATMYGWTFGLNGKVILGRTWREFTIMCKQLVKLLDLSPARHLIVYVHNLSFEFQFMQWYFTFSKVFALSERKPIQAVTNTGLEFRCSYLLSGVNLYKMGNDLIRYPIKKMVGDLNYNKKRHYLTPLTEKEKTYMINDVKVVMSYIQERIEIDGNITRIPLTKTGYVRKLARNNCLYKDVETAEYIRGKYHNYRKWMNILTLTVPEYKMLKRAFMGGFTHCSAWWNGRILHDVGSFDFASKYPGVIVAEQYPMSKGQQYKVKNKADFEKQIKLYCCLFDVEFVNLRPRVDIDHPISESKCYRKENVITDNGRVVSADVVRMTITEQDYLIYKDFYLWDEMRVGQFIRYKKRYLPTDFIRTVLKLYNDKTKLKGIEGREQDYMLAKELLNSCYGMMVTDIVRPEIEYDNKKGWSTEEYVDYEKKIETYNNDPKRFLSYAWGVWVTAYSRRDLFKGILEFGADYVYSDTDSVKGLNVNNHQQFIEKHNQFITDKMRRAMIFHKLPFELTEPETLTGKKKPLGIWEYEGAYDTFKSLGAKRYMVEKDGKISITVSGLNKAVCVPFIIDKSNNNPFEFFDIDMYIPKGFTGKKIHTYIDYETSGYITDYKGKRALWHEYSSVNLSESDYTLSLASQYIDYLCGLRE